MSSKFTSFIILAEMRTGSNFLEASLNGFQSIKSFGEIFNPHFIGEAKQNDLFGIDLKARDSNPIALIEKMKIGTDVVPGFRFFHDHDERVLQHCMADKRCAKIVLTRDLLETYVSREIVRQTGQWRLGDAKSVKTAKITFDKVAFKDHCEPRQKFQSEVVEQLQKSGQTAFYIDYEDLGDIDIINGLAAFLGVKDPDGTIAKTTKKQNPQRHSDKVENFREMEQELLQLDQFGFDLVPNFEPKRGPSVPNYVAAVNTPILFVPIRSGPDESIQTWLSELDHSQSQDLISDFTQKTLRQWKRRSKEHRSFAVVRHPVERLYRAYVDRILVPSPLVYTEIRNTLASVFEIETLEALGAAENGVAAHRKNFLKFVKFVDRNINGQTNIRVDGAWASQSEIIKGVGQFMALDHVFREDNLQRDLDYLASQFDLAAPVFKAAKDRDPVSLVDIYNDDVEAAVRAIYQRDYLAFGFRQWSQHNTN